MPLIIVRYSNMADVIMPSNWGMPFWMAFTYAGARTGMLMSVVGLYVSTSMSLHLCLYVYVSTSMSMSLCLCIYVYVSTSMYLCICIYVYVSTSMSIRLCLYVYISTSMYLRLCICRSVVFCLFPVCCLPCNFSSLIK